MVSIVLEPLGDGTIGGGTTGDGTTGVMADTMVMVGAITIPGHGTIGDGEVIMDMAITILGGLDMVIIMGMRIIHIIIIDIDAIATTTVEEDIIIEMQLQQIL